MRPHYDFGRMKGHKSRFATAVKQSITIRLDRDTVAYFKTMAGETGLPYQQLINEYLRDCRRKGRKFSTNWGCGVVGEEPEGYQHGARRACGQRRGSKESPEVIVKTPEYKAFLEEIKELISTAQARGVFGPPRGKPSSGKRRGRSKRSQPGDSA